MLGERLSERYEIVSELGQGGMGMVYAARDPRLNRDVAIKVIAPAMLTPETEQRFQTEAQLVAQMDHPSIVPIFDYGRHEGSLFFVMPIVEGDSMRNLMRTGKLTLGQVVEIGIAIAEALDYSHERGVVHRDIKPENVMVSIDAGGDIRVRVMDFGLARSANVSSLTKTGMMVGTVSYISPEQVSKGAVDGRSDLYSLGCVLYECVVNEVPFTGEMQSVLYRLVHEVPESPRDLGCKVDETLEGLILDCLAKAPHERPESAGALARDLRRYRSTMQESQSLQSVMLTATMVAPRPAQTPFVGREEEFHELQKRLNNAIRGECQFVTISGEAGAGKTRLVEELANLAAAREIRVLRGRFMEQHGAFPYIGFCEIIQEFFRQKEMGSTSSGLPDLQDLAPDLVTLFPMLSEIESIRSAAGGASQIAAPAESRTAEHRTQIFELLARTLTRLAGGKPLVLLIEDLHGAEASVEALQYIVLRLGPTPTLIAGTYRTTDIDRRHPLTRMLESFEGDRRFGSIQIGPFPEADHRHFLSTLTGGSDISGELAHKLYEATEGNPFFTKELVRSLMDAGSIAQDDTGVWALSGGAAISSDALPATIQQAVETRIGRLPDELRRVLAIASVMGKTFEFDDLEALADDDTELDDAVDLFVREGLLEEDRQSRGDRLTFSSGVVREVLYSELSRRKRRSLHRKFARRLEKRHGGRLDRIYPQLLYHYYEAEEPERTVEYGLLHAQKSLDSFSPDEAVRAGKTALEFLEEDWEGDAALEGEARLLLATSYRMAGDTAASLKEMAAAVGVFERVGDRSRLLEAQLAAAKGAWQARKTEETQHWVERGISTARAQDDADRLGEFLTLAATLANLRGDYARGSAYLEEVEQLRGSQTSAEQEEMPRGGRLVVGLANAVSARLPVDMQLTEEFEVYSNIFEPLVDMDDDGNLHPGLAASWVAHDDGRMFRFSLRTGVRFHDGADASAGEIKAAFEGSIVRAGGGLPPGFAAIDGAEALVSGKASEAPGIVAVDADTLEIRLREPLPIYPALLTDARTGVVRAAESEDGSQAPAGTGPFRVGSFGDGRIEMERNSEYWDGKPPRVDAVEFRALGSASAIAAAFQAGELDIATDLLPQDLEEILRDPRFRDGLHETPQKFTYSILFNTASGPVTREPRVRQALAGSLRVRDLVWQTLGRYAMPAVGVIPPGILGHDPGRRLPNLTVEEGRKLIGAAGATGLTLRAGVHPVFQDRYGTLLEGIRSTWAELGVELEVVTEDLDGYLEAWHANEGLDLLLNRWKPDVDDPDGCTHMLFHSAAGMFRAYHVSDAGDTLLERARLETRPAEREVLYRQFEELLLDDTVVLPLFHDVGYRVVNSQVKGIKLRNGQPCVNYSELGKAESATAALAAPRLSGGVIGIPMAGRVRNLEPSEIEAVEEAEVDTTFYETLIRMSEGRIEPWLAAEWGVDEGGLRYRFRLRDDVTFHDGRRLTARDVRFSLERLLLNERSPARTSYAQIRGAQELLSGEATYLSGVQLHSATELSIELERPLSFFPVLLASPHASIVPEGTSVVADGSAEGVIGTGPFKVARFEPGERLELERHPSYWRRGFPRCDRLIFDFGMAPEKILAEFRAGRFALAADLYPADVEALRRDPELGAGYQEIPRLSVYFAIFNTHHGPLQDLALRQKLVQAVDVGRIVRQTLGSLAIPADTLMPPGLLGHDHRPAVSSSFARPSSAKREGEIELTAAIHPMFFGELSGFTREVEKSLQEVGIRLKPVTETMAEFLDAQRAAEVDVLVGRWLADFPDADSFVFILEGESGVYGKVCGEPEIDRLIARGRLEIDPEARHAIYREIEEIVARKALLLPLFHDQVYRIARPEVVGLSLSTWLPTVTYDKLRIQGR